MSTTQRHGLLKSSQLLVQQEYSLTLGDVNLPDSLFPIQTEGMFSQIQSTEYGITNYTEGEFSFTRGHKQYELSNHLGNVLVTIQDRKWSRQNAPQTNCDYYLSYVVTITDYHAFGSTITERSASFGGGYRFGFNTQEKEVELGNGVTTAEFWMYDGKLGRRWNVDPKPNISISVYACFGNNPILFQDIFGDTIIIPLIFAKKTDPIFRPAILILKHIPETNKVLIELQKSKVDNVYLMMSDSEWYGKEEEEDVGYASTLELTKNFVNSAGKIDIEKFEETTKDAEDIGIVHFANASGFNFNTNSNIFLVSLNQTKDLYLELDKYDRAFVIYHELMAHVKMRSDLNNGHDLKTEQELKTEHQRFGNYDFSKGMRLYDEHDMPVVSPNTPAWNAFKSILKQKIDDGNASSKNKKEYKDMEEMEKGN